MPLALRQPHRRVDFPAVCNHIRATQILGLGSVTHKGVYMVADPPPGQRDQEGAGNSPSHDFDLPHAHQHS